MPEANDLHAGMANFWSRSEWKPPRMSDESALNTRLARQARAEALMHDDLLVEAFTELRAEYMKAWQNSALGATEGRERLWHAVTIINRVEQHLRMVAADGRLAQKEIEAIEGRRSLMQRMGVLP